MADMTIDVPVNVRGSLDDAGKDLAESFNNNIDISGGAGKGAGLDELPNLMAESLGDLEIAGGGAGGDGGAGGMSGALGGIGKTLGIVAGAAITIAAVIKGLEPIIKPAMQLLNALLMLLFMPLIPILKPALKGLAELIKIAAPFFKASMKGWEMIMSALGSGVEWIWGNIIEPIWAGLKAGWNWIIEFLTETLPEWLSDAWNFVVKFITETIPNLLLKAWKWIYGIGQKIWNTILKPAWEWFKGIGEKIWDEILKPAWEWFSDIGTKIWDIIKSGFNYVVGKLKDIGNAISSAISSIPGSGLIGFQHGGRARGGQPYMVGEAGPELFVPESSGQVIPNRKIGSMGTNVSVTINNPSVSNRSQIKELANEVSRQIQKNTTNKYSANI